MAIRVDDDLIVVLRNGLPDLRQLAQLPPTIHVLSVCPELVHEMEFLVGIDPKIWTSSVCPLIVIR